MYRFGFSGTNSQSPWELVDLVSFFAVENCPSELAYSVTRIEGGRYAPYIGCSIVRSNGQRSFQALECHVVLRGVEAAEPEVLPDFRCADPHLQQPSVVPQCYLWLVW